jgi:hypothetical protein
MKHKPTQKPADQEALELAHRLGASEVDSFFMRSKALLDLLNSDFGMSGGTAIEAIRVEAIRVELEAAYMDGLKETLGELWDRGRALQIDSYATGHPQAGAAFLRDGHIHIEVTDGKSTWSGKMPLPPGWNP